MKVEGKENPRKTELIRLLSAEHSQGETDPSVLWCATFHNFRDVSKLKKIQTMQAELFYILRNEGTITV